MALKIGSCAGSRKKKLNQAGKKRVPPIPLRTNGRAIAKLEAASAERSEIGKQHRKDIRRVLRAMYASAQILALDSDQWFDFTRHSRWKDRRGRPQEGDQKDAFDYVVRFYVGFEGKGATRRASLIKRALRPSFDKGLPAREIPKLLSTSGGISGLAKMYRDQDKEKERQGASSNSDIAPPSPKIVLKQPMPEIALKTKRLSRRGAIRFTADTEVAADGRIILSITSIKSPLK